MYNFEKKIETLEMYDAAYEAGNPLIPDAQYDDLFKEAIKINPGHPYFMRVGSDIRGDKLKLPFPMGSLDQIYDGDYSKWVNKFQLSKKYVVSSHKLDGVSCMLQYNDGVLVVAYSRGNGVEGADITRHVKKIPNVPKSINMHGYITIRGELIMSNSKFATEWANEFANPRNMVAGVFNRKETSDAINDIDFIAYQIVDADETNIKDSQKEDLEHLNGLGFKVVEHTMYEAGTLDDASLSNILSTARSVSDYELDGIVITINEKENRKNLSRSSSLNPEHSVKYKVLDVDSMVKAKVVKVHWELSKHGYFKPRVEIEPINLMGVTITYATGFNAKFINDNDIGPATVVDITRSGAVIPYIVKVVKPTKADMPKDAWHWNASGIEIIVDDVLANPEVIFKQVLDFFETLQVDLLKEASLRKIMTEKKLIGKTYEECITYIMQMFEGEWVKVIGSNGTKIYASLERRIANLTMASFLGAVKYFGHGFGVRKFKLLLGNISDHNSVWELKAKDVMGFDGFDKITSESFEAGIKDAETLAIELDLDFKQEIKTSEFAHLNVVMTGFRDAELQEKLEKAGAKVGSGVSKKTTHLITAEPNSTSTKAKKARSLGVTTLSVDEFKDLFNL